MSNTIQPPPELDVRVMVPIDRHTTLLKMFKELPVGESFIFINDHDPLPLYYEFRSIHGDVVGWEYLERGWPRRSAKLVLRIGLEQLAQHFGLGPHAVGKTRVPQRSWMDGERPQMRF